MRILFVTPYVPSHIRVRPYHLIKALSASHEVSLVSMVCEEYEREMVAQVANYCASVHLVPLSKARAYANCLCSLPTRKPLRVAYYQSPAFVSTIQQVIHEHNIQVMHGELVKTVPALRAVMTQEDIPCLYDSVDCISFYLEQRKSKSSALQNLLISLELAKMRRYEREALAAFDEVVITSARDRDSLQALGGALKHVQVIPNGVDTEYFTPPTAPREPDSLVFCAKLDYYPNSQAILHFCGAVLPLIWQIRPQVRLTIVGNNPPPSVRRLSADKRITITGYVPDIRPYLDRASVALAPLLVTAGMQNKVLEALAMGTPMVATPAACRSLQVKDGIHLLIAEGTHAYADTVLALLEDTQLAQHLGCAGRQYAEQHHSWRAVAHKLSNLYHTIWTARNCPKASADVVAQSL